MHYLSRERSWWRHPNVIQALLIAALGVGMASCDTPTDGERGGFVVGADEVAQYELVSVGVRAIDPAEVEVSVGGTPASTAVLDDSTLTFLVPEVSPGAYDLVLRAGDESEEFPLQVTVAAVPEEPDAYLADVLSTAEARIAALRALIDEGSLPQGIDSAALAAAVGDAERYLDDAADSLAVMDAARTRDLAAILAVNLPDVTAALVASDDDCGTPEECIAGTPGYVQRRVSELGRWGAMMAVGGAIVGAAPLGTALLVVGGAMMALELIDIHEEALRRTFRAGVARAFGFTMASEAIARAPAAADGPLGIFWDEIPRRVVAIGEYTPLQPSDLDDDGVIGEAARAVDQLGAAFSRANARLPEALPLAAPHLGSGVTRTLAMSDYLAVEMVSPLTVHGAIEPAGNEGTGLQLRFAADPEEFVGIESIPLEFDVVYTFDTGLAERFTAELRPRPYDELYVGPDSANLGVGRSARLYRRAGMYDGSPAAVPALSWHSSEPGIASVSDDGVVTGLGLGVAAIFAESADGILRDSALVYVGEPVVDVDLDRHFSFEGLPTGYLVMAGDTALVHAKFILGSGLYSESRIYYLTLADSTIARIEPGAWPPSLGRIIGLRAGRTMIRLDVEGIVVEVPVTVVEPSDPTGALSGAWTVTGMAQSDSDIPDFDLEPLVAPDTMRDTTYVYTCSIGTCTREETYILVEAELYIDPVGPDGIGTYTLLFAQERWIFTEDPAWQDEVGMRLFEHHETGTYAVGADGISFQYGGHLRFSADDGTAVGSLASFDGVSIYRRYNTQPENLPYWPPRYVLLRFNR